MRKVAYRFLAGVSVAILAPTAHAAEAPENTAATKSQAAADADAADEEKGEGDSAAKPDKNEIVVTGTYIRGNAPTGANVVQLNSDDIEATGQSSTTQLLAQIPQLGSFNTLDQIAAGSTAGTAGITNRPNARGTNDDLLDSVGNTLILIDGNRSSGVGTRQSSGDADGIPAALLERVEANLDGGSATYGSDAIGGVLNFVTKRRYDGVELSGHYGFADSYSAWDVSVIAGKEWSNGGFYVAYSHSENTPLYRIDRDYYRVLNYDAGIDAGVEVGTSCDEPNISVSTRLYGVNPDGTVKKVNGVADVTSRNLCTLGKQGVLFPEQNRHNVNAVFSQDFGDDVRLTVRGRYARNFARTYDQPFTNSITIRSNNPYYQNLTGTGDAGATQRVLASFGPAYGDRRPATNKYTQYGVNAELDWDISDNWHARFIFNYDRSKTNSFGPEYSTGAIGAYSQGSAGSLCSVASAAYAAAAPGAAKDAALAAAQSVCINPYNIEASAPALLADIANWDVDNQSTDRIIQTKAIVDGTLFELPGGPLKIAVGAEYLHDRFELHRYTGRLDRSISPFQDATRIDGVGTRSNWSLFGEANIPLVTADNAMFGIQELRVSLQGRYDNFSNTGGIFNPKFGLSYKPVEWFRLRGTWSKSFRAPSAVDVLSAQGTMNADGDLSLPFYSRLIRDGDTPVPGALFLAYNPGVRDDLQPQTGTDWSIGGEFTAFEGFFASISYYHIELRNPFITPSPVVGAPTYADFITYLDDYSPAEQAQLIEEHIRRGADYEEYKDFVQGQTIYALFDNRLTNLGGSKVGGIDYQFRYRSNTSWGSVSFSLAGNIKLQSETQNLGATTFTDNLISNAQSKHRFSLTAGFRYGEGWRGQVTWNHSDGYDVTRTANLHQDHVGAFNVVNLFTSYTFQGDDMFQKGLQLSLTINNILDTPPPTYYQDSGSGTANGSTLGRFVQFGVTKTF